MASETYFSFISRDIHCVSNYGRYTPYSCNDDFKTRIAPLLLYHLIPSHFQRFRKMPLDTLITDGHLQANIASPVLKDENHQGVVHGTYSGIILPTKYMSVSLSLINKGLS